MIKRISSLLAAIVVIIAFSVCAFAHEIPDPAKPGSITVTVLYDGKPVFGGNLTIYKVGYVVHEDGNYGFAFTEDFAECTVPITETDSAELPEALAKIADEKNLEGITKKIDTNGQVKFENLEHGLYLAVQHLPAYGFGKISPFLISVPLYDGEHYIYDVDASPKIDITPDEPDKPDDPDDPDNPPDKPEDKLPDTGLMNWPVPVMAAAGIVFIGAGILLRARGKE